MKILVVSDLHGWLPKIEEPIELLLVCGDICPAHDHYFSFQNEWIRNGFAEWVNKLHFKDEWSRVVLTWGNHDFVGERFHKQENDELRKLTDGRLIVLKNEYYEHEHMGKDGLYVTSIFGTPYCKIFGNWAFMMEDEKLREKYGMCPKDADIVISHDSPSVNGLGMINEGHNMGLDVGNIELDKILFDRTPKYFFSGHIHTGNHKFEKSGETYMANVSFINERYNPTFPILSFEIDDKTKELINYEYIDIEADDN